VIGRRTPEGGYCFYRTPEWGVEEPDARDTLAALKTLRLPGSMRRCLRRPRGGCEHSSPRTIAIGR